MRRTAVLVGLWWVAGCSDVVTFHAYGPEKLVVGGRGGYSIVSSVAFNGCDPYSKVNICTPDINLGLPRMTAASSDAPAILDILEIKADIVALALAGAPGQAVVTLTSEDGVDHLFAVDSVAATRIETNVFGCEDPLVPVGTQQCVGLTVFDGASELDGGALDVTVDDGALEPAVVDPNYAAQNIRCYSVPTQPGSTSLSTRFAGLTTSLPFTYYELAQVESMALRLQPAQGPYRPITDEVLVFRTLSVAGRTPCESGGTSSDPSVWTTTWTSETPSICTVGLYGAAQLENHGTAANIQGVTPGTCRVRVSVGGASEQIDVTFTAASP